MESECQLPLENSTLMSLAGYLSTDIVQVASTTTLTVLIIEHQALLIRFIWVKIWKVE